MIEHTLNQSHIVSYGNYLKKEDRNDGTVEKYLRDVQRFFTWLNGTAVTQTSVIGWREYLLSKNYAPVTINSMLAALNGLFRFMGWADCRVRFLKIQRIIFRDPKRELTRTEYSRLVETALAQGNMRLALLMESICATGIRVSEVRYLTVEAAKQGRAEISMKGKIRTILLPGKLARKLLKYARKQKITSGEIFLTRGGKCLSRYQIWGEMKELGRAAGVCLSKIFPHNLRHLFATIYYKAYKDIACLADILGHSSIETTRIYLLTSGGEHEQALERLGLIL